MDVTVGIGRVANICKSIFTLGTMSEQYGKVSIAVCGLFTVQFCQLSIDFARLTIQLLTDLMHTRLMKDHFRKYLQQKKKKKSLYCCTKMKCN